MSSVPSVTCNCAGFAAVRVHDEHCPSKRAGAVEEVKPGCDCIAKANAALAEHNTRISVAMTISKDMSRMGTALLIPTEKIAKKGKPALKLRVSFCPLCGVEL